QRRSGSSEYLRSRRVVGLLALSLGCCAFEQLEISDVGLEPDVGGVAEDGGEADQPFDQQVQAHLHTNAAAEVVAAGDIDGVEPREQTECVTNDRDEADDAFEAEADAGDLELAVQPV